MKNTEVCTLDGKPLAAFILIVNSVTTNSTNYFPFHWGLQAPPPMFFWSVEEGESWIDRTRCTSERGTSVHFWSVPLKSMSIFIWPSSFSVFLHIPNRGRTWTSPYDCRLRVNFHCWLRLWLQTSTVSPPILALRLSRQRLLPTWRSFELDSICSHFCWHTMIHII